MAESPNRQKDIFLKAIELPSPAERAAFVTQACGADEALRRQVGAMLQVHGVPDSFLEKSAAALGLTVDAPDGIPMPKGLPSDRVGTRIGPYKLLEQIGEGGMGVVFVAEQQEPVRRTVALKIIKPGMDSGQVLARFEAERQALALMDHPNIAKVLDAGATDDGRPYFVMEVVKGTPITAFCDANKLPARQRLELFIPVCQALQHAHQKGVIHRDIKPSNVLIALYDDKPVPKVIDFGVAKAAGNPLTERTLHTGFGSIVGTPEYMSPEQATFNQLDIDTRSDVYSLGVLLYELLTGATPVDKSRFKEAAILEMLRVVREEEPPRPSVKLNTTAARASIAATRGTDSDKLAQMLRGELDWIVMKSLEKDRNRRYETAAGLARDVERYLKDELVEARPPSLGYRLRKTIRKNRGAVIAASLLFIALLGGVIGTTGGMLRAWDAEGKTREANVTIQENLLVVGGLKEKAVKALNKAVENERIARQNETKAIAAEEHTAKALTHSDGLRLVLQSELARPTNPSLALLLAIEGAERHPGLLANNALLAALDQSREERTLAGGGRPLCYSADGRRLVTAAGHDVRIWDVAAGKELVRFEQEIYFHENAGKRFSSGVASLPGHPPSNSWITAASFDRDGGRVLTTSAYGIVALWDAATGKQLRIFQKGMETWTPEDEADRQSGHEFACPAQFSPDGRFVLATFRKARLWDAASGKEHLVLEGHEGPVFWAEFSRDGKKIITASRDKTARIWDAASGKQLHVLKGHATNAMLWASFSPDGSRAMTVTSIHSSEGHYTSEPLCRLWDAETGKELASLGSPTANSYMHYSSAQFSPDSSRVLTHDYQSAVEKEPNWHLWDAKSGKHLGRVEGTRPYSFAAFSPDNKRIAMFGERLDWWNVQSMVLEQSDRVPGGGALFSPDGQRLATDGGHIWAVAGEAERRHGRWTQFPFLALSSDARLLATRTLDPKELAVWDLATHREIARIQGKDLTEITFARFSPDGRRIVFGHQRREKTACVADATTGQLVAVLPGGSGKNDGLRDADISPDNLRALTVSESGLYVWDLATGKELATVKRGTNEMVHARFSPDGRWIVAGHDTGHQLLDVATGKVVALFKGQFGHGDVEEPTVFSPDSRRVLTTDWWSNPPRANVWYTATGKNLVVIAAELSTRPATPAFSSDGVWIIMACLDPTSPNDQKAVIWEAATGKPLLVLKGQANMASISPDKTWVVTASDDKTVRLWDARTGGLQSEFHGHQEAVTFAQFLPEGRILSVDKNGSTRVWPVDALSAAKARAPRELTPEERQQYEVPAAKGR